MFEMLKKNPNIQFVVIFSIVFSCGFYGFSKLFGFDYSAQIDQVDAELTMLLDEVKSVEESLDEYMQRHRKESVALLENRLKQNEELVMQLQQRVALVQNSLNNTDSNKSGLMAAQAEIDGIQQILEAEIESILQKRNDINHIETADLTD